MEQKKSNLGSGGGSGGSGGSGDVAPVTVTSGAFTTELPVGGMTVGKIKSKFSDRLDIDAQAEAILDGEPVDSDTIVKPGQTLQFIRKAGEKGNGNIVIEGESVTATTPEGVVAKVSVAALMNRLGSTRMSTGDVILPTGIRAVASRGNVSIWCHESSPEVRNLKWITDSSPSNYGGGAKYKDVKIALPYVNVFTVFNGQGTLGSNECFFRNDPIKSLDDELYYPALLNCSAYAPFGKEAAGSPLSWICTQHLRYDGLPVEKGERMREMHSRLLKCLYETGFNRSSESHEGASWYKYSSAKIPEIATIGKWEENTQKDPIFAIDIKWLKTGYTVKSFIERSFRINGAGETSFKTATDVARAVFGVKA